MTGVSRAEMGAALQSSRIKRDQAMQMSTINSGVIGTSRVSWLRAAMVGYNEFVLCMPNDDATRSGDLALMTAAIKATDVIAADDSAARGGS